MPAIRIHTPIPGPKSQAWLKRASQAVPEALFPAAPLVCARSEGAIVEDLDGNRFIDLASGLGALNTGHSHPKIVEAIRSQAERFQHTDYALVPYDGYIELCEELARRAPLRAKGKAALFNSGAEAVENAVKIARKATGRRAAIAFEGAFHGRTLMALTLTSRVDPYKKGFGPFAPDVYRAPYPDPYRHPRPESLVKESVEALERLFVAQVPPQEVAAIIIEPVQGEGGFIVPPAEYFAALREIADRHGILLIVDEIQTGFGRTGRFFALEHFGVKADLVTMGKSLGAGLPLSAVAGDRTLMDAVEPGGIGGTTIGNPLACRAALAVLRVIEEEGLVARAEAIGQAMRDRLTDAASRSAHIGDVRGLGAMVAVELIHDHKSMKPASGLAKQAVRAMAAKGVIAATAGLYGQVVRFLPPLVIRDEELEEAMDVVCGVLESL